MIPFLAFKEYLEKDCSDCNEIEKKLLQNLCSVYYNASCAGFHFEPYLLIVLEKIFNEKICKEHPLFADIKNIDKLSLLSCKSTIRTLHDNYSTKLYSKGEMTKFNLHKYLDDPFTAFFMPEKDAGPDLVYTIEFEAPGGIVEVPIFLQAKLWKNSPSENAIFTLRKKKTPQLKIELKEKVINCLRTKYHKAHEHGLSWIRFLVVYPAEFDKKSSHYICNPGTAEVNELLIIIDSSNASQVLELMYRMQ
ncbi:hypothetical protein RclHR1_06250005 [Rhizophagus clarus]|uniref:Uncharacterized protein n=1 Tax=Rhizophagus clarus TaxID=94130 RepID=A0A2Z6RX72_9GLOM|nr:hypothetical protein RclHR1_06250005 [Rhizophagus clarus]GES97374.1 hypothetical protein GLOIN_2v1670961 [Rhizophagus clarus]